MFDHTFNAEFQRKLIRLALEDDGFCTQAMQHVRPEFFESDALRWCWNQIANERTAGRTPTVTVLRDLVVRTADMLRPRYAAMLESIAQDPMREDGYIRHALSDFVRRNIFVDAFHVSQKIYNAGRTDEAMEIMRVASDRVHQISFSPISRHNVFDDLSERDRIRKHRFLHDWEHTYPTGIDGVDAVLDGGLSSGELGCWMADAKEGKSIFLVHLACYTCRVLWRPVLFCLLEGDYIQTASRIDAWFSGSAYQAVKRSNWDVSDLSMLRDEYRAIKNLMVLREMTDGLYTVSDIRKELDDQRGQRGWVPGQIVVDYGDLLRSSAKAFSEEEHQRNAFGELKMLSHQDGGYAVWTATQSQRPSKSSDKKDRDDYVFGKPVMDHRSIADSYNKVRRVDFLGSINRDKEDKENKEARLFCCVYRDNEAGKLVKIKQDLSKMRFVDLLDPSNRPDSPEAIRADQDRKERLAAEKTRKAKTKQTEIPR